MIGCDVQHKGHDLAGCVLAYDWSMSVTHKLAAHLIVPGGGGVDGVTTYSTSHAIALLIL